MCTERLRDWSHRRDRAAAAARRRRPRL